MADDADDGSNTSGGAVVSRRLMPFVPLAIAMLAQTALLSPGPSTGPSAVHEADEPAVCADDIPDYQECHSEYPNGCSLAAKYDAYLNLLKNQLVPPTLEPLRAFTANDIGRLEQDLPPDLSRTNHEEFMDQLSALGDGHVVSLTGYLFYAKKGGKESSNCQLSEPDDIDYHLGIGFDPGLASKLAAKTKLTSDENTRVKQSSVIVEMTPHWRAQFRPEWSLGGLTPLAGRQVRVVGQLLVDNEHFDPNDDCAFPGAATTCWRASVWELHPVTRFQVCASGTCSATGGGWEDLENLGAVAAAVPAPTPATTTTAPTAPCPPATSGSAPAP